MKNLISKLYNNQKIRYLFVGCLNTGLNYTIYFTFNTLGVWYILSNTAGFIVSILNSYFWNKYFVFKERKKSLNEIAKFLFVYLIQYFMGILFLMLFVEKMGINKNIAGIISIFFLTLISYLGHKNFTFKSKK